MSYHPHTPAPPSALSPDPAPEPDPADAIYADPTTHPAFAHDPTPFTPVPVAARHDGWTPARQRRFVQALAETGVVREAAAAVGMSVESAYRLRRRMGAQSFRMAWDAALDVAMNRLADALADRAINGVEIPHYYRGELVGTHRRHDNRLGQWLLRTRRPERFSALADKARWPVGDTSAQTLDAMLYAMSRGGAVSGAWWGGRPPREQRKVLDEIVRMYGEELAEEMDDEGRRRHSEGHAGCGDAA